MRRLSRRHDRILTARSLHFYGMSWGGRYRTHILPAVEATSQSQRLTRSKHVSCLASRSESHQLRNPGENTDPDAKRVSSICIAPTKTIQPMYDPLGNARPGQTTEIVMKPTTSHRETELIKETLAWRRPATLGPVQ